MKPIIRVEGLSKQYRIGAKQAYYATLRESLTNIATAPFRRLRNTIHQSPTTDHPDTIWALKDVSFEVQPGEVVGIIGRNGAGKSTLLKILSRITEPTEGRVDLYGRVGSLLEVGTGFHPELTGRENIYLNGAILGMKRSEIERYFDEMVAFAEIEKFIDTPVKHYSSGMYLRLAFAVAAHLEPEILLVDEVLAVGDIAFQKKCLNKMQNIGVQGRTVLFVSHDLSAIGRLCSRAILLNSGTVASDNSVSRTTTIYLDLGLNTKAHREWQEINSAPGNEVVRLVSVRVRSQAGDTVDSVPIDQPVGIEMIYEVLRGGHVLVPNYHFFNEEGLCAFVLHDLSPEWRDKQKAAGAYKSTAWIPGNFLAEGAMIVGAALTTYHPFFVHCYERDAVAFHIIDSLNGKTARGHYTGRMPGVVRPLLDWVTEHQNS